MQPSVESLFTVFWKERRTVRVKMVGYVLSNLEDMYTDAEFIAKKVCEEYGLKSFPPSIVVDIIETEMKVYIGGVEGNKWKFKNLPKKQKDPRLERIIKKFRKLYTENKDPIINWPQNGSYDEIVQILIDVVNDEILSTQKDIAIADIVRYRSLSVQFEKTAVFKLSKASYSNQNELIDTFKQMWKNQDADLIGYLIDYTGSIMRIRAIKWFEESIYKPNPMENTTVILDGNVIFSLCLETNSYHILAVSAVKTAIENGLRVVIIRDSWGEFTRNLNFWDYKKGTPGGWTEVKNYGENEIIKDFSNCEMRWEDYYIKSKKKISQLKDMGIQLRPIIDIPEEDFEIELEFRKQMRVCYEDELSGAYSHDLLISRVFVNALKDGPLWLVSRHGKLLPFISNLTERNDSGAIHLSQFHGWMVEFLSMSVPEDKWRETAKSLLDKTILDSESRTPETLATLVSALLNWEANPKQMLEVIKKMPRYKGLLAHWERNEDIEFEKTFSEMLDTDLINSLAQSEAEKEQYKERMKQMRINFNEKNLSRILDSARVIVYTTIDLVPEFSDKNELNEILAMVDEIEPTDVISAIEHLIVLTNEFKPQISERLEDEIKKIKTAWDLVKSDKENL